MISRHAMMNRVLVLAPWLTLALLLGMSRVLPNRSEFNPNSQQRKAEVAHAMQSIPMFIGRWVGQDKEVPKEAQKLLRPNAILSRIYTSAASPTTWIVVVHCSDARDLDGHYPPKCYPAHGWITAHLCDSLKIHSDEKNPGTHISSRCRRFAASMPGAHHNHIVC